MKIGIVGAGQLGRMLALAGYPLGLQFQFLDPATDACAGQLAPQLATSYTDRSALAALAEGCDAITFEFENVPHDSLVFLSDHAPVFPSAVALESAQDRLTEKSLFGELDIPTPRYVPVTSLVELEQAVETVGLPAVLKTRRMGYDGKGQHLLRTLTDLPDAWSELGNVALILEQFVEFHREVSLVGVRNRHGEIRFYPLTENEHRDGVLYLSRARSGDPLQPQAEAYVSRLMNHLNYVGVLALEFFQLADKLLANEFAPRVHNSAHWTIEGAETSQFENHLRAVADLPLGSTRQVDPSAMVNLVGQLPPRERVLAIEGAHLHDYGKAPRVGRKVGHATVRAESEQALDRSLEQLLAVVSQAESGN